MPTSYILILLSVCHGARVCHRRPTGLGPALPDSRISTDRARRGGCQAGSVTEGRPALWSPAQVERAQPFSGSQHRRCRHGRSLVASMGGTWLGGGALHCCRREKRKRTEEKREEEERREEEKRKKERGLEEERCVASSERRGGGGQRT